MASRRHSNPIARFVRLRLEALGLWLFLTAIGWLPARWRVPMARSLSAVLARRLPLRRRVLEENLDIAFGPQPGAEREALLRGVYRQTLLLAMELAYLFRATPRAVTQSVRHPAEGQQYVDELLASGQGFVIASAHFGNWEWLGAWFALTYGKLGVVYKPMHNAYTERLSQALRRRYGITIFSTRERVPRAMFAHLRAGGVVAILADQDARSHGEFFPFFGVPASTATGLASLAVRLNVPILPGFGLRTATGQFQIKVFPPLRPDPQADREAEVRRLTQAYLARVEEVIRLAPDQYFWWHRRWKTRPRTQQKQPQTTSAPAR